MSGTGAEFIVIGAGMAGASAAYELAAKGRVIVLERESQPGYHTTGRSAALYAETYGNQVIRAITTASRAMYMQPPPGFTDHPMLSPRGTVIIGRADQQAALDRAYEEGRQLVGSIRRLTGEEVRRMVPILRPEHAVAAIMVPDDMDIDVHALHQGYLKGLRARGGSVITDAELRGLSRINGEWKLETAAGGFTAPVVVNAAGAWADVVGGMVGAAPIGLVPKRRTALTFDPPSGADITHWPAVIDADEQWYIKPEAGRILASPADETPSDPCDAQPDEMDVAICVDRVMTATTLDIRRITHRWAGLRSFVKDKTPVVGFDDKVEGFFWLAGQGGYGIQTAPAMGRIAAALARREALPADVAALGITPADLAPQRLR
ncbi:NAD(P)/FAD-dependent oxidoreductase [Desertibaculum subflavum]|uniref:NAD(P)/FAD-dependent oxidoreductase n=1 Tax=Desertibaculum subflavum TaxID=2268458 RepID=UPI000E67412C